MPRLLGHLDDERAHLAAVGIGVGLEHAGPGLGDEELERVEDQVGAHPHVAAVAVIERGSEIVAARGAHGARRPVGADDQVKLGGQLVHGRGLRAEPDLGPQGHRPALEDPEQLLAAQRAEPVPARPRLMPAVVDVDVGPVDEVVGDLAVAERIGVLEHRQRLIGEHHAEPEGVLGAVALEDDDLAVGRHPAHEDGEVQPAGAAAGYRDPHGVSLTRGLRRRGRTGARSAAPAR